MAAPAPPDRSSIPSEDALQPGQVVGRYVLIRQIGEGGMGVVFEAFDPELDRHVALKFFHDEGHGGESSAQARERLLQEAKTMAAVSHPNVITVFDVGVARERVFVAMELIRGQHLGAWLKRSARDWRSIARVLVAAGEGLAGVHAQGLVHRDFKPENVLVDEHDRVYVLDFGLARRHGAALVAPSEASEAVVHDADDATPVGDDGTIVVRETTATSTTAASHASQTTRVAGTPSYMSPEQHRGGPLDRKSDQFSFAVTAYEAFYGLRPFQAPTLGQLRERIELGDVPAPVDPGGIPDRVFSAIAVALAPRPEDRHPELRTLLDILAADPAAARRRHLERLALVVLACAAIALGVPLALPDRESGCEPSTIADRRSRVLNPMRRQAVRARAHEAGGDAAVATVTTIIDALDTQLDAWQASYEDTCDATAATKGRLGSARDMIRDCLARRLSEARGLSEHLLALGPKQVPHLDGLAATLSPIDDCRDPDRLRTLEPVPDDPRLRNQVMVLRREFDRTRLLLMTKQREAYRNAVRRDLQRAEAVGYPPTIGEAAFALAQVQSMAGRFEASIAQAQRSLAIAEAWGHDTLAAMCLSTLMFTQIYQQQNFEGAEELIRHGRVHVDRAPTPETRVIYLHMLGPALGIQGRHHESEIAIRQAYELYTELYGMGDPRASATLQNLAVAQLYQGRVEESVTNFRRSIEIDSGRLGSDHPALRLAMTNLSLVLHQLGRVPAALKWAERSASIQRARKNPVDDYGLRTMAQLSRVYQALGRNVEALEAMQDTIALRRAMVGDDHPRLAIELAGLGRLLLDMGRWSEARATAERAGRLLERAEASGPMMMEMANAYTFIARMHIRDGQLDAATRALENGFKPELRGHSPVFAVQKYMTRARLELARGRPQSALQDLDRAQALLRRESRGGGSSGTGIARLRAEARLAMGQARAGLDTLQVAITTALGQLGPDNARLHPDFALRAQLAFALDDPTLAAQSVAAADRAAAADEIAVRDLEPVRRWLRSPTVRARLPVFVGPPMATPMTPPTTP